MVSGDEEVKLLLEAFQMSVSACLSQPSTPVLRAQMLGRLMSVRQSSLLKVPHLSLLKDHCWDHLQLVLPHMCVPDSCLCVHME